MGDFLGYFIGRDNHPFSRMLRALISISAQFRLFVGAFAKLRKASISFVMFLFWFWLMTNLTHSFLMYLFHASTCFEQQVLIIKGAKLY
jgi:hypothetical protein